MSHPIVTADELLDVADAVLRLAHTADKALQYGISRHLESVLPKLIDAAQLAALRAVQDLRAEKLKADP